MSPDNDPFAGYYADEEDGDVPVSAQIEPDPFAGYYADELDSPSYKPPSDKKFKYMPDEKTPEDIKKMSVREKMAYNEELKTQREYGTAKGLVKGTAKGLTAGLSELALGGPEEDDFGYNVADVTASLAPITGALKLGKPVINLAKKSPVLAKQLESLANILTVGVAGGAYESVRDFSEGKPVTLENFLANGVLWSSLELGLKGIGKAYEFSKSLFKKAEQTGTSKFEALNTALTELKESGVDVSEPERVAAKALSILEKEPASVTNKEALLKDVARRDEIAQAADNLKTKKISEKTFDDINKNSIDLAKPIQPKEFSATIDNSADSAIKEIAESTIRSDLDSIAQRAESNQQLGESVKADMDRSFKATEKEFNDSYRAIEDEASYHYTTPEQTGRRAYEILRSFEELSTKYPGYGSATKNLVNILEDAGYTIIRDEAGVLEQVVAEKDVAVDKLMRLKRRLNKYINWDATERTAQDRLRPLVETIRRDIEVGLAEDKSIWERFQKTDLAYGERAEKFGRDSLRKFRKNQATESIEALIKSPTALQDLKAVTSPEQYKQIERELLEHLNSLKETPANAFYREIRRHISPETDAIAKEILSSKYTPPKAPTAKPSLVFNKEWAVKKSQESMFKDLAESFATGTRPEKVLSLWSTKEGQGIVKNALDGNPNKTEILKYLEEQSFYDFIAGATEGKVISPDGKINFKSLKKLMRDPAVKENIRLIGGEEAVNFFNNLETLSKQMEESIFLKNKIKPYQVDKGGKIVPESVLGKERLKKMARTDYPTIFKIDDFLDTLSPTTKHILGYVGVTLSTPATAATYALYRGLRRLAMSKKAQGAFKEAAKYKNDPKKFKAAIAVLDKELKEDTSQ